MEKSLLIVVVFNRDPETELDKCRAFKRNMLLLRNLHNSYFCICIVGLYMVQMPLFAQTNPIQYTASFTKTINKYGLEVYEPVEQWLHVYPLEKDDFMKYDLVLQNDINDFEVRYRIRPYRGKWKRIPQAIEINRLVTSISSNEEGAEIYMAFPDSTYAHQEFNAASCHIARFSPKLSFSEKPFGSILSIQARDGTCVDVIVLTYNAEYSPYSDLRHMRFRQ